MALAVLGYGANVRGAVHSTGYGPLVARDWRNVASGVLGFGIAIVFRFFLVARQDFVAHVVVENKARVRLGPQVLHALDVIRNGHIAIALALALLVGLQLSVAVDQVVEAARITTNGEGKGPGSAPGARRKTPKTL